METIQNENNFAAQVRKRFGNVSEFIGFMLRFFRELFQRPFEWRETLLQCYKTGNGSLPLVSITAFIMGLVLTLQSRPSLARFGAESMLPGMIAVSVVKEIGPVLTALICAGKIASRIGAELGSMRVTEQIDAMEVSAIDPYKYLVVTRTLATTLMVPVLIIFSDTISLFSSYIAVNMHDDVSLTHFISLAISRVEFMDLFPALVKSFFFGFAIGIIGCYKGYNAYGGTASVGNAANTAVITSSVAIFVLDLLAVQITDLF